MAIVLGAGDSFHLVPRALALCTTGLENFTVPLGLGKWITSVTMTVFYVLLYYVWRQRYHVRGKGGLTAAVYALAGVRIALCMMPVSYTHLIKRVDVSLVPGTPCFDDVLRAICSEMVVERCV